MPGSSFCKQKVGASDTKLAPTMVRAWGLEPQRREAREPKSRMSTNSIMPAYSLWVETDAGRESPPGILSCRQCPGLQLHN